MGGILGAVATIGGALFSSHREERAMTAARERQARELARIQAENKKKMEELKAQQQQQQQMAQTA